MPKAGNNQIERLLSDTLTPDHDVHRLVDTSFYGGASALASAQMRSPIQNESQPSHTSSSTSGLRSTYAFLLSAECSESECGEDFFTNNRKFDGKTKRDAITEIGGVDSRVLPSPINFDVESFTSRTSPTPAGCVHRPLSSGQDRVSLPSHGRRS